MSVEQQLGTTKDSNTIFVSNLPPTVTENILYELLSTANPSLQITSLHLIKKNSDHPYAYANFATPEQAVDALNTCNFLILQDYEIVLTKHVKPNTLAPGSNLYVSGFAPNVTPTYKTLFQAFSVYGPVISVRLRLTGPKACCYVQYETLADAQSALTAVNNSGLTVDGELCKLFADVFKSRANRERLFTNVFIRNFPANYPPEQFKALCEKYGPVNSVWIPTAFPSKPGSDVPSKTGYGFANFVAHEDALKAIEGLKKESIGDFNLAAFEARDRVSRARDVQERSQNFNSGRRYNGGPRNNNYYQHKPMQQRPQRLTSSVKFYPAPNVDIATIASMVQNSTNISLFNGCAKIDFFDYQSAAAGRAALPKEWSPQFYSRQRMPQRPIRHQHHHAGSFHQQQHPFYMQQPYPYQQHPMPQHQQPMQHQQQQRYGSRRNNNMQQQRSSRDSPEQSNILEGDERQELGSALYYAVEPSCAGGEMTSKVTGMLLELPTSDIRNMLGDHDLLISRINDARALLQNTSSSL